MFSYISIEDRIPADHPMRAIQALVNPILAEFSPRFQRPYARMGRPSIAPECLLRALLLQQLYTIRRQDVATLATAFHDEKFITPEVERMCEWLDSGT